MRSRAEWIADEKGPGRERWMTANEIASYLNVSQTTVKLWHKHGKIPPPDHTTPNGWKLWSPASVTAILRYALRTNKPE